jgi:hypothetical protein
MGHRRPLVRSASRASRGTTGHAGTRSTGVVGSSGSCRRWTVSRELRWNVTGRGGYRPFEAHRRATARGARHHRRRLESNHELRALAAHLLSQRWSPQQISRHLKGRFPDDASMRLCHESIYQAVYQPGSVLLRPSRLAPHHRSPLRTGRDHRRAHQRVERRRPRFEQPMLTIHQRPLLPKDRSCCATTSRKEPTSARTPRTICWPSRTSSTTDRDSSSKTALPPTCSLRCQPPRTSPRCDVD